MPQGVAIRTAFSLAWSSGTDPNYICNDGVDLAAEVNAVYFIQGQSAR